MSPPDKLIAFQIAERIREYCRDRAPWNRRLWSIGPALAVAEYLEAAEAVQASVLFAPTLANLRDTLIRAIRDDPGVGDGAQKGFVIEKLKDENIRPGGLTFETLQLISKNLRKDYLARWAAVIRSGLSTVSVERMARCIASHLLDCGFSGRFLFDWFSSRMCDGADSFDLEGAINEAQVFANEPEKKYSLLVPFTHAPLNQRTAAPIWRDSHSVRKWLDENKFCGVRMRVVGAVALDLDARDKFRAVAMAEDRIERLCSRAAVGGTQPLVPEGRIWLAGEPSPFPKCPARRGVDVHSLERADQIYQDGRSGQLDNAIELLGALQHASAGAAVGAGWAAVESLLIGPGEGADRVLAADRLALLASCSFPRAELTTLAHEHQAIATDSLATTLKTSLTNRDKALLVAKQILDGGTLSTRRAPERLAEARMKKLLFDPKGALDEIRRYLSATARRIYRQRNLVMHWGKTDGVALEASLRTGAPVIGAGVDRIAHATRTEGISPLHLVARGEVKLNSLNASNALDTLVLLEP